MRDSEYKRLLNTHTWKRLRREYLSVHPLCEDCEEQGRTRLASEIHHIIPIGTETSAEGMRRLAFDPGNFRALCHECHARRHEELDSHNHKKIIARQERLAGAFAEKWLRPSDPDEAPGG